MKCTHHWYRFDWNITRPNNITLFNKGKRKFKTLRPCTEKEEDDGVVTEQLKCRLIRYESMEFTFSITENLCF